MFEMRQSRLDRQDQLDYLVRCGIPNSYQALSKLDSEFNRLQEEYKINRVKCLQYIKDMNAFETKLYNSI